MKCNYWSIIFNIMSLYFTCFGLIKFFKWDQVSRLETHALIWTINWNQNHMTCCYASDGINSSKYGNMSLFLNKHVHILCFNLELNAWDHVPYDNMSLFLDKKIHIMNITWSSTHETINQPESHHHLQREVTLISLKWSLRSLTGTHIQPSNQ